MANITELNQLTTQVRRDILRMVHKVNSGHPGGSLGCAEFFVALYNEVMELKEGFDMDGKEEDLFFLSNGHISPVFYSVLARRGHFPVAELSTFRLINSRLQGHPTTHEGLPGIRMASGSLGQGMSVAIGAAQAKKLNNDSRSSVQPSWRWRTTRRSKLGSHYVCFSKKSRQPHCNNRLKWTANRWFNRPRIVHGRYSSQIQSF